MEIQDLPVEEFPESASAESAPVANIEDQEFDRIAFGLWHRGSFPELDLGTEAELEEVACHASCL